MLLIDGVKYELWTPKGERAEEELEQMVKGHASEIFGEDSIYLDKKQKLKSMAGVGSIPDGLVIMFGNVPEWHIVEVELSSHDPYSHIVPQVDRFLNGIENRDTRNKIIEALYDAIYGDELLKLKTRQEIGRDRDVHKFLADLIAGQPTITIIIEKYTEQLKEALRKYTQKRVVEFQTFTREGVGLPVHAHLFKPLYEPAVTVKPDFPHEVPPGDNLVVSLQPAFRQYPLIPIHKEHRRLFPGFKEPFILETDVGNIKTWVAGAKNAARGDIDAGSFLRAGIPEWYRHHPELAGGSKVQIWVVEPTKTYRLEIVKG